MQQLLSAATVKDADGTCRGPGGARHGYFTSHDTHLLGMSVLTAWASCEQMDVSPATEKRSQPQCGTLKVSVSKSGRGTQRAQALFAGTGASVVREPLKSPCLTEDAVRLDRGILHLRDSHHALKKMSSNPILVLEELVLVQKQPKLI